MMKNYVNNHIKIFELCKRLAILLGDKEAIADLKLLYERHPEMFKDIKEVSHVINEVVKEPEIITNAKRKNAILAVKRLNPQKMGEVAIENDNGTNIIFHTNQKNISKYNRFKKDEQILVETSSTLKVAPTRLDRYASKSNDSPKCYEAPSISANNIISNSNKKRKVTMTKQEYNEAKAKIVESLKGYRDGHIRVVATVLELMNPSRYGFEVVNGTKQTLKDLGYSAGDARDLIEFGYRLHDYCFQNDYDLEIKTSISRKIMDRMKYECYELVEGRNEGYEELSKKSTDKAKTMINNHINKELKNLEQEYNETNTENENTSKEHKPHKRRR